MSLSAFKIKEMLSLELARNLKSSPPESVRNFRRSVSGIFGHQHASDFQIAVSQNLWPSNLAMEQTEAIGLSIDPFGRECQFLRAQDRTACITELLLKCIEIRRARVQPPKWT